ncbi:MAG: cobaltochelatase subunit CobN, partial [Aestuariivirga sp.]
MHLLATASGVIDGAAEAVDLKQSPADIVVLSAADSEIATLARAYDTGRFPTLRLANFLHLQHNLSVDLYLEKTLSLARLIVLRLLGGASYWPYGLDQIVALAKDRDIKLVVLPGDAQPDPELMARSNLPMQECERLRKYLVAGGQPNAVKFLGYCQHLLEATEAPPPAEMLPANGIYRRTTGTHMVGLLFYRSVLDGAQTAPIDALIQALAKRSIGCVGIFVTSLKDKDSASFIHESLAEESPSLLLNATSFAASSGGAGDPLAAYDCPVLQVVLSTVSEESWRSSTQGLGSRDLAMNVVLPELDGRIHARAISFKSDSSYHEATQCRIVTYKDVPDRVDFVADLAASWIALRHKEKINRKVAIILANYPNKDGRIANGVGYDTPASTIAILKAMKDDGYDAGEIPAGGNELIETLQRTRNARLSSYPALRHVASPEDDLSKSDRAEPLNCLSLEDYRKYFDALPYAVREQITSRWDIPETDPFFHHGAFHLAVQTYGNVAIGIQPARGYN